MYGIHDGHGTKVCQWHEAGATLGWRCRVGTYFIITLTTIITFDVGRGTVPHLTVPYLRDYSTYADIICCHICFPARAVRRDAVFLAGSFSRAYGRRAMRACVTSSGTKSSAAGHACRSASSEQRCPTNGSSQRVLVLYIRIDGMIVRCTPEYTSRR